MKKCNKCKKYKDYSEFYKNKQKKDGHCYSCKECKKKQDKKNYNKDIEKSREIKRKSTAKYRNNNPEKDKQYAIANREKYKEYRKNNKDKLRENYNEWRRNKKKKDPLFKLKHNLRRLIGITFQKNNYFKKSKTYKILGCTYEEFKIHIESQFEDWMTWKNHGKYTGNYNETWQYDHIIPISAARTEEEVITLNHFSNFQPLCSKKNLEKSNR
jgi:hypothetical protein